MATSKLVEKTTEEVAQPTQVVVEPVVEEKKEEQEVVQYPGNATRGFRQ
jgi:hypothetical protein